MDLRNLGVVFIALAALSGGIVARAVGQPGFATDLWTLGTIAVLATLLYQIVTSLSRGEFGLDIVAALSMTAALVFGETLAAAVVALMYAGGNFLEAFAEGRARREMHALLSRMPRTAMRYVDHRLEEVPLDALVPGDRIMVRAGDVAPVDGTVASGLALMDQSALTGESMPVRLGPGDAVMSGATNAGDAFDLVAARRAEESTFAGIVRLVEAAQRSRAPMARLADRYALGFLGVTLGLAGAAWGLTGDPIRAVAVLVVATPCPLILAVPVALVSGLSRAATQGVLIKGAKALEGLSRIRVVVLDKTGTLTDGRPQVIAVNPSGGADPDEVLRVAAALDQVSKHPIAQAIVAGARARGLAMALPADARETPGEGVSGRVGDRQVILGGWRYVTGLLGGAPADLGTRAPDAGDDGAATVLVAIDGRLAGTIVLADPLRPGIAEFLQRLRGLGVERVVLATGDRAEVARALTRGLGIDHVSSDLTPDRKVLVVLSEHKNGTVMMVGDGVNDAPALAAADVGVAMGVRGAAASAEAADVVLLVDEVARILPGIEIAQGARRIALQSVIAGIGLSVAGMVAAAFGYLAPVQGALLQEAIDVAVILNALRVLRLRPRGAAPGQGARRGPEEAAGAPG